MRFQPEQPFVQQIRRDIGPHNGDPENAEKEKQHNGKTSTFTGENPVQFPVFSGIIGIFQSDAGFADTCCLLDIGAAVFRGCTAHFRILTVNIRNWGDGFFVGQGVFNPAEYAFKALSVPGSYADHRNLQFFVKTLKIYPDVLFPGLVHEIYAQQHMWCHGTNLENKIEVPFQTGGVADSDHHIRMTLQYIIPGNLLLAGAAGERITPGQVYKTIFFSVKDAVPGSTFHCLAAPVSGMLMHACECVEYSALAYIGIANQCYITEWKLLFHFFFQN